MCGTATDIQTTGQNYSPKSYILYPLAPPPLKILKILATRKNKKTVLLLCPFGLTIYSVALNVLLFPCGIHYFSVHGILGHNRNILKTMVTETDITV